MLCQLLWHPTIIIIIVVAARLLTIRRVGNGRIPDSTRTRLGSWFSSGIEQIHCGLCRRRGAHLLFGLWLGLSRFHLAPAVADGLLSLLELFARGLFGLLLFALDLSEIIAERNMSRYEIPELRWKIAIQLFGSPSATKRCCQPRRSRLLSSASAPLKALSAGRPLWK
jgi:hypothetical protein